MNRNFFIYNPAICRTAILIILLLPVSAGQTCSAKTGSTETCSTEKDSTETHSRKADSTKTGSTKTAPSAKPSSNKKPTPIKTEILKKIKLDEKEKQPWKIYKDNKRKYSKSAQKYFKKAYKLQRKGEFEKAINDYKKAIYRESNFYEAWFNRGLCNEELKRYKRAIYCFERMRRSNARYGPIPSRHLALLYLKTETQNLERAKANYEEALRW